MSEAFARAIISSWETKLVMAANRGEILLGHHPRVVGDLCQHRRLENEPGVEAGRAPSAGGHLCATLDGLGDDAFDLGQPASPEGRLCVHVRGSPGRSRRAALRLISA